MAGEKFRQEAARFTEEYGFRFSIEKHLEGRAILKRSDMDTVRKGRDREALEEYYDTLSDALIAYLESKTYMADGKAYETEDISIRDFALTLRLQEELCLRLQAYMKKIRDNLRE